MSSGIGGLGKQAAGAGGKLFQPWSWRRICLGQREFGDGPRFEVTLGATTIEVAASHVAMISHPAEVTALITAAAETCATTAVA